MNEKWPWPPDLDAVIAAPEFHTVLYEDDRGGPFAAGSASWGGPLTPHTFENVGETPFHALTVEMKDT
jgi:hypothetical protein